MFSAVCDRCYALLMGTMGVLATALLTMTILHLVVDPGCELYAARST